MEKPWRLRDVVEQLERDRLSLWLDGSITTSAKEPLVSTQFDHETAEYTMQQFMGRLPLIFDLAASTVMETIQKQAAEAETDEDDEDLSDLLPESLKNYRLLQKYRIECLKRSNENREYAKRKGGASKEEGETPATTDASSKTNNNSSSNNNNNRGSSHQGASKEKGDTTTSSEGPKFTRNTPASSAAALDFRFTSSRAILCAAANLAWSALTPGEDVDGLSVPQRHNNKSNVNLGAVILEAKTLAQRTIHVVENAVRRSNMRFQYRRDHARQSQTDLLQVSNPFDWRQRHLAVVSDDDNDEDDEMADEDEDAIPYRPNDDAMTDVWQYKCRDRFLTILEHGAGHVVYHDLEWTSRHGRIADLLRDRMGPHLILTTEPEVALYAQEFHTVQEYLGLVTANESRVLRALPYGGSKKTRRSWRKYFGQASGLPEAPFHVLITSFKTFLEDYLHFCQIPFDISIVDEGVGLMAAAQGDSNSSIRSIWDTGIFSTNDQHIGLAGTPIFKEWNFQIDNIPPEIAKEARVGLTTRHRVITASTFSTQQRTNLEVVPVSCLVSFVSPHFADVVREEWDRSRISSDTDSMDHFRRLVARSTVVHSPQDADTDDMDELAVESLSGTLGAADRSFDRMVPRVIPDEEFVSSGKVASSRRWTLNWLGNPAEQGWLRYELGVSKLEPILDLMKLSQSHGHVCEEVTTASSTTSSGASGQVAGTLAYRLALHCGRHFGSDAGLRQHIAALHAPPGTWLCRTCGVDCVTSQARTHHERSCGQPSNGAAETDANGGGAANQGSGPKSGVGKKKGGRPAAAQTGTSTMEEKDADGSIRVPGYRGVWINQDGKHFVKIDGTRLNGGEDDGGSLLLFDSADDAGKKYDEVVKENKKKSQKLELNFKPDGSRIVYEDIQTTTSGLGGSATNVVPALSVINIKDLPPDVKPLLRDPRQTSRTGGNSKRHVYAYRGVCRQARKGHDRWQSQISFMGQNHYLGTFDSEWDAAAIYAWAHLILYGEEATRQAQKEGEEAAAAFEREKRDIAAGKIPEPPPKPEKKKRVQGKKKDADGGADKAGGNGEKSQNKRKRASGAAASGEKKSEKKGKVLQTSVSARLKENITPILAKGVAKAPVLSNRESLESTEDSELVAQVAQKLSAARQRGFSGSAPSTISPALSVLRPCLSSKATDRVGIAMLVGISPTSSGWDLQGFVEANQLQSEEETMTAFQLLSVEYDEDGANEKFISVLQGTVCVIGCASRATRQAYQRLGGGPLPVGGSVGPLDCHIGGIPGSCSESSACIRWRALQQDDDDDDDDDDDHQFQIECLAADDIVTVNGRRLTLDQGSVPLQNGDICSVGARVFSFLMAVEE